MAALKEKKSRSKIKVWHYATIAVVLIIAYLVVFQMIAPEPTAKYLAKVVKRIDVPTGYSQTTRDNTCDNGTLSGSTCFIRYYTGRPNNLNSMRSMMLQRLKQVGFSNAAWIDASGPHAARINAYCDATTVNIYLVPGDTDSSIEVEADTGNNSFVKTNCPWL